MPKGFNQLNRAVQSIRQPGSAFKAFVYGAGIESKKITAASSFYDVPVLFKGTRTVWKPSNYEKSFKGRVLVRNALAASLNIISVLVVDEVAPHHAGDPLHPAGAVGSDLSSVPRPATSIR